jgi:hypothetical protein
MDFVDHYYHCMVRPRFADGGDDPQMLKVATNIFKKQLRTAEKG